MSPVVLAEEVEAFITHPVPYGLDEGRAELRGDVRTIALASLLGDLVAADAVSAESVTGAIRGAIAAGIECRHRPVSPSAPEA